MPPHFVYHFISALPMFISVNSLHIARWYVRTEHLLSIPVLCFMCPLRIQYFEKVDSMQIFHLVAVEHFLIPRSSVDFLTFNVYIYCYLLSL